MFQRILVALDRSDAAEQVLDRSIQLALTASSQLMLLHVLSPEEDTAPIPLAPTAGMGFYYEGVREEFYVENRKQWERYAQNCLEQLRAQAAIAERAGVPTEFTQQTGNAGPGICAMAQNWHADAIVVGRRGRSGLKELLLGSVSNYVVHHAPCAVIVLNPLPETEVSETNPEEGDREPNDTVLAQLKS
ncbi:universal stress protein [Synechococcus sp. PCC 7336]|uniref:universal stress protein n=1 Tax=Synechococcus sp. PCC 7336 TaxID=195250 RepID=UPI00034626B8|nr:universal stress protein [Synechococcus sp. PCC 7336]